MGLPFSSLFVVNLIISITEGNVIKSHFLPISFLGIQSLFTVFLPWSEYIEPKKYAAGSILTPLLERSKSVLVIPISHKSSLPQNG